MFRKSHVGILGTVLLGLLIPAISQASDQTTGIILGGSLNAPIRMEVFSDFECPGCRLFYRELVLPTLQNYASKDKVCVIYHEFPLVERHRYAPKAARYCQAAYRIGRDRALRVMEALFTHQSQWAQDGNIDALLVKTLSKEDFAKLKSNLRDPSVDKSVNQGMALGTVRGVRGTPTMFVYYQGKKLKVENPQQMSYPVLKGFFDQIVK